MRGVRWYWIAVAVAVAVTACGGKRLASAPAGLDLAGIWHFNAEATAAAAAGDSAREQGRGVGGLRGRMPGGGMRPSVMNRAGAMSAALQRPIEHFELVQTDSMVTFRFAAKNAVRVPTDGRSVVARQWPDIGELRISARWTDAGLRIERSVDGVSVVEVLSRAPGSPRLIITRESRSPFGNRTVHTVYDRVEPGADPD